MRDGGGDRGTETATLFVACLRKGSVFGEGGREGGSREVYLPSIGLDWPTGQTDDDRDRRRYRIA